jgi:hypothetical protein
MKTLTALLIFAVGLKGVHAQGQTWQSYTLTPVYIGLGAQFSSTFINSPPILGTPASSSVPAAPIWQGALGTASTGTKLDTAEDSEGDTYNLYTSSTAPLSPLGYVSKTSTAGTQYFGLSFAPQLLAVSPSGDVFLIDSTGVFYSLNPNGGVTEGLPLSGNTLNSNRVVGIDGPIEVDEEDNITVPVLFQNASEEQPLPATAQGSVYFLTAGPVPFAWPLANSYSSGASILFSVISSLPVSYQWSLNGTPIPSATGASYTPSNSGTYSVSATTAGGTVSAVTSVSPPSATLTNISCRAYVGTGANIGIGGFTVTGQPGSTVQVLIRAVGPTLSQYSLTGVLAQPVLSLFNSTGVQIATNTGWGNNSNVSGISAAFASSGAFPIPSGSADSALLMALSPGTYTAQVSGLNGSTGIALIEVYEVPVSTN